MTNEPTSEASTTRIARRTARQPRFRMRMPGWLARMPLWARIAIIAVSVLAAVVVIGAAADAIASAGRIHPGVYVGELAVGGQHPDEATAAIATYVSERASLPVAVTAGGATWEVAAESVALSVDATGLAGDAYAVGRGDVASALVERVRALFGGVTVPMELDCDDEALRALIDSINAEIATPAVNAGVTVEGASVTRVEPVDGIGVDFDGCT